MEVKNDEREQGNGSNVQEKSEINRKGCKKKNSDAYDGSNAYYHIICRLWE